MFYFRLSVTFGLEITGTIGETKGHNYEVISTWIKKNCNLAVLLFFVIKTGA